MYAAASDPYCYPGTNVLKNRADLRNHRDLRRFELAMTSQRFDEPLPAGRLSRSHYYAIHHHLFQDVYSWAGKLRSVRIVRAGSSFCYPENIANELHRLFAGLSRQRYLHDLPAPEFVAKAADFLAELNAIHAFRDGNGRAQLAFVSLLAAEAGHPFDLSRLRPAQFLRAMVTSFFGDETPLARELGKLVG